MPPINRLGTDGPAPYSPPNLLYTGKFAFEVAFSFFFQGRAVDIIREQGLKAKKICLVNIQTDFCLQRTSYVV